MSLYIGFSTTPSGAAVTSRRQGPRHDASDAPTRAPCSPARRAGTPPGCLFSSLFTAPKKPKKILKERLLKRHSLRLFKSFFRVFLDSFILFSSQAAVVVGDVSVGEAIHQDAVEDLLFPRLRGWKSLKAPSLEVVLALTCAHQSLRKPSKCNAKGLKRSRVQSKEFCNVKESSWLAR